MKKVQKKLLAAGGTRTTRDDVAPAWFAPAMRDALKDYPTKDDLEKRLDAKLEQKLSGFATKQDLDDMTLHLTGLILSTKDQMVTKSKFKALKSRFVRSLVTIGGHETRLIQLENPS